MPFYSKSIVSPSSPSPSSSSASSSSASSSASNISLPSINDNCFYPFPSGSSITNFLKLINQINLDALNKHRRTTERPGYFCVLCKKNGETPEYYQSHTLRDANGKVTCPILLKHSCEICGATGPMAHTRSYCPFAKSSKATPVNPPKRYHQNKYRKSIKFNK